jgi:hypothetical protein
MIIYDKGGLANLHIQEQAAAALDTGLLEKQELNQIKEAYPTGFYTPNLLVRIGLFILISVGWLFAGMFLSLILQDLHVIDQPMWPVFLSMCTYAAAEFFTKINRLYRSGIDDALIWISAALLTGGIIWALENNPSENLLVSTFILALSFYLTLRFADPLMAMISFLSLLAAVYFAWNKAGAVAEATMSFVIMAVSFVTWFRSLTITEVSRFTN